MKYRTFGRLDYKPSALGLGAMRLPTKDGKIDYGRAKELLYYAIDNGVNYVDTAYPYHGGESEIFIGDALSYNGYRDKVKLVTKLPSWAIKTYSDFDKYFDEQRKKLKTDVIDFYHLHALNKKSWENIRDLKVIEWAEKKKAKGEIGHLGFSFHDKYENFEPIVDFYDWTFCMIQYNFFDVDFQAGDRGLNYLADKDIAVIVMEPLRGGQLVEPQSDEIAKLWEDIEPNRGCVDLGLQWIWNNPKVSLLISGMSDLEQVKQNIEFANKSGVGTLSEDQLEIYDKIREEIKSLKIINCTDCKYCLPCPSGVNIPNFFNLYNDHKIFGKWRLALLSKQDVINSIEQCNNCLTCEEKCPQNLPISELLGVVKSEFSKA